MFLDTLRKVDAAAEVVNQDTLRQVFVYNNALLGSHEKVSLNSQRHCIPVSIDVDSLWFQPSQLLVLDQGTIILGRMMLDLPVVLHLDCNVSFRYRCFTRQHVTKTTHHGVLEQYFRQMNEHLILRCQT